MITPERREYLSKLHAADELKRFGPPPPGGWPFPISVTKSTTVKVSLVRGSVVKAVWGKFVQLVFGDDRAVVAIETAIIATPMIMLLGVMAYTGIGFYSQAALTYATQQAATASVAGQGANPQTIFAQNIPTTLTGAAVACTPAQGAVTCNGSGVLQVPFAGLFGANSTMTLSASATAAMPAQAAATPTP